MCIDRGAKDADPGPYWHLGIVKEGGAPIDRRTVARVLRRKHEIGARPRVIRRGRAWYVSETDREWGAVYLWGDTFDAA